MKKLRLFIPISVFLLTAVFLYKGLFSDPTDIKNANLEREFPEFELPNLMDESHIYNKADLLGEVTLVNVWGTWCVTCRVELPFMTQLRNQGVRIVGVYYDNAAEAAFGNVNLAKTQAEVEQMLAQLGNPFQFNIYDVKRDLSLDLGVTGAPESFLIDQNGVILAHRRGAIDERVWQQQFQPLIERVQ
ncbi:DsbE family thiol:disulfide interchange protein [Catenovulum adriaticum]|uniref:DsbE family thiol:disulfide interchange protein n=1 Tax=Catenovulum adriaticum TaxID=2984846 RepID=A0ABY7AIV5_9ALTE|nr:DsbE family thiol:disulfide interchange protein [Catenovulum sp. TS8]WAJ69255.1 DsbE family thiol:disulfide interchange protein [Catenovulum sp. TS8]